MLKRRIGIVPGHTAKAPGCNVGPPINLAEHTFALGMAQKLAIALQNEFDAIIYMRDGHTISETYEIMRVAGVEASIELHVNAEVSGLAQGTETLSNPKWTDYATIIQNSMVSALGRQGMHDRGIQIIEWTDTETRGWENVHSIDYPNCLIEPFFGSNVSDCKLMIDRENQLVQGLAKSLETYFLLRP